MKFSRSEVVRLAWSAQSVSDRQQLLVSNGLYVALLQNIPEQPDQLEWNMMGFQVRFLGCGYSALGGTWLPEPCSHGQLRSQDCGMGVGMGGWCIDIFWVFSKNVVVSISSTLNFFQSFSHSHTDYPPQLFNGLPQIPRPVRVRIGGGGVLPLPWICQCSWFSCLLRIQF